MEKTDIHIPLCRHCLSKGKSRLRKLIMSDGRFHIFWQCSECMKNAQGSTYIKQEYAAAIMSLYGKTIDDIPVGPG